MVGQDKSSLRDTRGSLLECCRSIAVSRLCMLQNSSRVPEIMQINTIAYSITGPSIVSYHTKSTCSVLRPLRRNRPLEFGRLCLAFARYTLARLVDIWVARILVAQTFLLRRDAVSSSRGLSARWLVLLRGGWVGVSATHKEIVCGRDAEGGGNDHPRQC